MLVVENEKLLESYIPPLTPKSVAKIEDSAKVKGVVVQKNPQIMILDKTLFCFTLMYQQQLLDLDKIRLNLVYLLHLHCEYGLEAKQCVM